MTDNEKLIEARRRLTEILSQGERCLCTSPGGSAFIDLGMVLDALEAAEKAHTPSDDEPESDPMPWVCSHGERVKVFDHDDCEVEYKPRVSSETREPSRREVLAAAMALVGMNEGEFRHVPSSKRWRIKEQARAALRAASAVTEQGENREEQKR